jgi:hypothetical protein
MADCKRLHLLGEFGVKALPITHSALTHMPQEFIALPELFQN